MRRHVPSLVLMLFASVAGVLYAQQPQPSGSSGRPTLDYDYFKSRVQPILGATRPGHTRCVTCHAKFPAPGFHMEAPGPNGTWTEAQTRQNFEAVSRRVVPGDVARSRLLRHPLRSEAGGDQFHFGGKHWDSPNDPEWQILYAWVVGKKPTS